MYARCTPGVVTRVMMCVCVCKDQRRKSPFRMLLSFLFLEVNKSQGQSFQKVAIYLPSPIFVHGRLYIALLRARGSPPIESALPSCLGVQSGMASSSAKTPVA